MAQLTNEQLEDLKLVFDSIDVNKNGLIELEEFQLAMKRIDPCVSNEAIGHFFTHSNKEKSNQLDFAGFLAIMQKYIPQRNTWKAQQNKEKLVQEILQGTLNIPSISEWIDSETYVNPMKTNPVQMNIKNFVTAEQSQLVLESCVEIDGKMLSERKFVRAGAREQIVFEPTKVKAAIVTCGGLCPGLNRVVRELVTTLTDIYGAKKIYGIKYGYEGFYTRQWIELTPQVVRDIHNNGGTFLGTSRGGFDVEKIVDAIEKMEVNQVYVIGGDGTHRGAQALYEEVKKRKLKISVACVPKTIDNDFQLIDQSFGFLTAVEEAQRAIRSAKVEAEGIVNGVGIVKLMGRQSGFIALYASLASGDVNYCLIPEASFHMPTMLKHMKHALATKGHIVIVIAEGAASGLLAPSGEKDKSGNPILPDVGKYLRDAIKKYFDEEGIEIGIKYLDPTYMIRSIPANASDSIYCTVLAQNCVHGAMAGFTGFTVGLVNTHYVYLPINAVTTYPKLVDPNGVMWFRLLQATGQPDFSTLSNLFVSLAECVAAELEKVHIHTHTHH